MTVTLVLCLNKIDLPLHQNNAKQWLADLKMQITLRESGCFARWVCWESQVFWTYMILAPFLHFKYSFRISLHNLNIWFVSCCEAKLHDHIFIFCLNICNVLPIDWKAQKKHTTKFERKKSSLSLINYKISFQINFDVT